MKGSLPRLALLSATSATTYSSCLFSLESLVAANIADAERSITRLDAEARSLANTEGLARILLSILTTARLYLRRDRAWMPPDPVRRAGPEARLILSDDRNESQVIPPCRKSKQHGKR